MGRAAEVFAEHGAQVLVQNPPVFRHGKMT